MAEEATELDPGNVKPLFWWARSLYAAKDYQKACQAIGKAVSLEPNNPEVAKEAQTIKEAYQKFIDEEHRKYAKIFK